jgi:hypothetical protein
MISDALAKAVNEIDEYLSEGMYEGELLLRILELRGAMDALRRYLDTLPRYEEAAQE